MYSVRPARSFERDAKKLLKKYASLRNELIELGNELAENPTLGIPLGRDCYKIKIGIKVKGRVQEVVQELLLMWSMKMKK